MKKSSLNSETYIKKEASLRSAIRRFLYRVRKGLGIMMESRMAMLGLILFSLVIVMAVFAPLLATHDPVIGDFMAVHAPSSTEHFMGTDSLGRDVWSRVVYGARKVILVAGITIPAQMLMGIIIGGLAGYFGGKLDNFIMRINDALLSFPGLILFLALLAVFGVGLWQCMLALTIGWTPSLIRMVRGLVLAERERDYVKAAKLIGERDVSILYRQIIPNVSSPLIVLSTIRTGGTILAFASLTFLGLGPPPPDPSWGLMLNEAQGLMETAPMVAIWPGLMISITVLSVNLLGDGLRDILDPRLTEK